MEVSIKKIGERDGVERFILVDSRTRRVISAKDVSEVAIRRFFQRLGADGDLIDECLDRARERFGSHSDSDVSTADEDEDDLLFELGLDEDE